MRSADRNQSIDAINIELKSLESHEMWGVIKPGSLPTEARPISSRMVLPEKVVEDGRIARFKARLVGHGFRQKPGIDFSDTYSPTISYAAICIVQSKAAAEEKQITQLDIVTAFLESRIDEELYLKLPKHFVISRGGRVELEVHNPEGKAKKPDTQVVVKLKKACMD